MQRVSSLIPTWERTRSVDGKTAHNGGAFGRVFGWADKIAASRLSTGNHAPSPIQLVQPPPTKFGREAYWPSSLEKECEKAARILKSFCTDGFLSYESDAEDPSPATTSPSPTGQNQTMKKVPPRIVQNAVGLAIFSCMRSGLWMSGSGGSGILIARKADGTWSPPSGILLHTAALGFVMGVDIYDCVLVINSVSALEMFTRSRVMLGADLGLTLGPVVPVGLLENDYSRWKDLNNSVLTYLKARGRHRAVQLDGSLVTERGNENEKFYGTTVEVLDILAGNVRKSIPEIAPLFEAIKAAEGRTDYDVSAMHALSLQPAPGDATIETPLVTPISPTKSTFGLVDADDPDPFGIIALEMAGLEIREAGAKHRPTSTQIDYSPTPTSPLSSNFHRQSIDTYLSHSNRGSCMSSKTQATAMTDAYTQTDIYSARTSPSPSQGDLKQRASPKFAAVPQEDEEVDYTKIDMSPLESLKYLDAEPTRSSVTDTISPAKEEATAQTNDEAQSTKAAPTVGDDSRTMPILENEEDRDGDADDEDDEDDDEEPVIFEVATASQPTRAAIVATQVTQVISAKGALVTIPKRVAPTLPARNPARSSQASKSEFISAPGPRTPTRGSFESTLISGSSSPCPSTAPSTVSASRDDEAVKTPTTLKKAQLATEASSSADDESVREPQTPKSDEDSAPRRPCSVKAEDIQSDMPMTHNLNAPAVKVV